MNIDLETLGKALKDLSVENLDELLEHRDSAQFDSTWVAARSEIPEGDRTGQLEEVFVAVSRATNQHEIASYVADDLELILDAKKYQSENRFVEQLAESYAQGKFPHDFECA